MQLPMRRRATLIACTAFTLLLLTTISMVEILLSPRIISIEAKGREREETDSGVMFFVDRGSKYATFKAHLRKTSFPAPDWYSVLFIGSIDDMTLNDQPIPEVQNYTYSKIGPLLREGDNLLAGRMSLTDPLPLFVLGLHPSIWNPFNVFLLLVGCLVIFGWIRFFHTRGYFSDSWIYHCILGGSFLRYFYGTSTPYYSHAYDFNGHIDYIAHVAHHWTIPQSGTLWEAYQMPLYYFLLAPLYRLGELFGFSRHEIAELLTVPSIILTILTLIIGVRIAQKYFANSTLGARVAAILLAVFPGLVYLSSQASNDVLLTLIGFLWAGSLLGASHEPQRRSLWVWVGIWCGIGMLTKMSAAPWIGISFLVALLASSKRSLSLRLSDGGIALSLAILFGGWLYPLRSILEPNFGLVANAFRQWGTTPLPLSLSTLFGFNPIRLIHLPFRQFSGMVGDEHVFIEDMIRTAHFGSVSMSEEAAIVLVLLAVPLFCMFVGAAQEARRGRLVLPLQIIGILVAALLMRLEYPFQPSQHFRYIAVAILPMIFLTAQGVSHFRRIIPRTFVRATLGAYTVLCALIVFVIAASG